MGTRKGAPQPGATDVSHIISHLKHLLPSQAPLKDFIHHNTLHAYQHLPFHEALREAGELTGGRVYLPLQAYRAAYQSGKIIPAVLDRIVERAAVSSGISEGELRRLLFDETLDESVPAKTGRLRSRIPELLHVNLDKAVHPLLFRYAGAYIDQGIALKRHPETGHRFLASIMELEKRSWISLFASKRARSLLLDRAPADHLLQLITGYPTLYEHYLYDQQFAHPGWSGMISVLEDRPDLLIEKRRISLEEFIQFELLLEIAALDARHGEGKWSPLGARLDTLPGPLHGKNPSLDALFTVWSVWQDASEQSYYDGILKGLQLVSTHPPAPRAHVFQAICCIDDRTAAFRRHLERAAPDSQTFGTAGFFNVEFYFQPEHGKFTTKVCPAPVTPKHLIRETEAGKRHQRDVHYSRTSKGFLGAWALSQTAGFWAAAKLARSIFFPAESAAAVSSFRHMDPTGSLSVECQHPDRKVNGLQVGFTVPEMTDRVEGLLKSIGLTGPFAPLVYIIGHGASSINNTHYAGYDCGACSGRPGSVNARVAAAMANHPGVRAALTERGVHIPETTQFVGALHDTTRDELAFYDLETLSRENAVRHQNNQPAFRKALALNAKERARRFRLMDIGRDADAVHEDVKLRSLSLFEPRPEWNHATNALCIVGRREINMRLFLDRRAFLNSYNYQLDPEGTYLLGILRAVAPVCGGINLEYYFSRVDNHRWGAGTKLSHNVVGLIGVNNGMDGDLRPGLPRQMINIHDPLRLLVIVEHLPETVLRTIQSHPPTYEWFMNGWVNLACIHPETRELHVFEENRFVPYQPCTGPVASAADLESLITSSRENLPIHILN